jgi:hypothetical protein
MAMRKEPGDKTIYHQPRYKTNPKVSIFDTNTIDFYADPVYIELKRWQFDADKYL